VMKKTALYDKHVALGAKMVEFAGFQMPVSYEGIQLEHKAVREKAGVFDVSHMGEFFIEGPKAQELLNRVCSNDTAKLKKGAAQYNYFPNYSGGIIDDLIVYKMGEEKFMLVVNASNIEKDWAHLSKENKSIGATLKNESDNYSLLAVQGPKAAEILQSFTTHDLGSIPFYHFIEGSLSGIDELIISATGYTGSGGFEIYCKNETIDILWDLINEAGIKPIGLAARDTLRLEMGYCLYGNDIDETTHPIEAGLGWVTKFNHDFINKAQIEKDMEQGVAHRLVGFKMVDKGIPRQGYEICDEESTNIGRVTSGTSSPSLGYGIGLGYVASHKATFGSKIYIQVRNKSLKAEVVKLPFYKI
jgi:aminomethyltransferase